MMSLNDKLPADRRQMESGRMTDERLLEAKRWWKARGGSASNASTMVLFGELLAEVERLREENEELQEGIFDWMRSDKLTSESNEDLRAENQRLREASINKAEIAQQKMFQEARTEIKRLTATVQQQTEGERLTNEELREIKCKVSDDQARGFETTHHYYFLKLFAEVERLRLKDNLVDTEGALHKIDQLGVENERLRAAYQRLVEKFNRLEDRSIKEATGSAVREGHLQEENQRLREKLDRKPNISIDPSAMDWFQREIIEPGIDRLRKENQRLAHELEVCQATHVGADKEMQRLQETADRLDKEANDLTNENISLTAIVKKAQRYILSHVTPVIDHACRSCVERSEIYSPVVKDGFTCAYCEAKEASLRGTALCERKINEKK
jgi:hypothetical protein